MVVHLGVVLDQRADAQSQSALRINAFAITVIAIDPDCLSP